MGLYLFTIMFYKRVWNLIPNSNIGVPYNISRRTMYDFNSNVGESHLTPIGNVCRSITLESDENMEL